MISFSILSFGRKNLTNSLSVYVKSNTGGTLSVDLDPEWEIKDVKEIIAPQLGLTPQEVKIIFAGKELSDTTQISECDLGEKSILHAVRTREPDRKVVRKLDFVEEEPTPSSTKPLNHTLVDLQLTGAGERSQDAPKAHFYIHCTQCAKLCNGKLRVRCGICRGGAFTVHRDPENWPDVLEPRRITGHCETHEVACTDTASGGPPYAEFYFKCAVHPSQGETDYAAPLSLIKTNLKEVPCLACSDISNPVLVFPCQAGHVTCLDCFRLYCSSRLGDRQFLPHPEIGYTLACPAGCENSFITEIHHFKLLTKEQYDRYQRFATEEFVLQAGGVLCPQPGCGMGLLVDPECTRITCQNGCGYVFCRNCLQGYHLGECLPNGGASASQGDTCQYAVDPARADRARWDEASNATIKVITKPCPKCRIPTERAGGCSHMACPRPGCNFEWCWICQTTWSRECMGAHWFN